MLAAIALALAVSSAQEMLATAVENYENRVASYSLTLRSSKGRAVEEIRYFYKKPGFIRMEFVQPHKGAVLVFNPVKQEVRVKPFGILNALVLTLSPDNMLVKSSSGHTVDKSDLGALLKAVKRLQSHGKVELVSEGVEDNKPAVLIRVEGEGDFAASGIHRYDLWLDKSSFMPLKVSAYNIDGALLEEVRMDDLIINREFPDDFFNL